MNRLRFTCNGAQTEITVSPDRLLVDVVREDLGLTGTKLGCGTGDCGACTVLLDGHPVTSCLVYAVECEGGDLWTVEGVATTPVGAALVDALLEEHGVQCGICTPGIVVAGAALISRTEQPLDNSTIKEGLAGNLCRCTGYYPIIRAVVVAAERIRGAETAPA